MGFKTGAFVKIWNVEDKGKYSIVELSSSKKNKQTNEYETDFSSKFVRFIGKAHTDIKNIGEVSKIKLGDVEVTNSYNKETKQSFTNFLVFSFESENNETKTATGSEEFFNIPDGSDTDLPFQ